MVKDCSTELEALIEEGVCCDAFYLNMLAQVFASFLVI